MDSRRFISRYFYFALLFDLIFFDDACDVFIIVRNIYTLLVYLGPSCYETFLRNFYFHETKIMEIGFRAIIENTSLQMNPDIVFITRKDLYTGGC